MKSPVPCVLIRKLHACVARYGLPAYLGYPSQLNKEPLTVTRIPCLIRHVTQGVACRDQFFLRLEGRCNCMVLLL